MLIEVICERAHCVIYEYAIVTVKFVADEFKGRIRVKPVVRRGSKKNVDRYLELCRINGKHCRSCDSHGRQTRVHVCAWD